ncbi:TPA: hypothetical protein DCX16_06945 [bacterium]|nr:hypothetical protein [bacterium]
MLKLKGYFVTGFIAVIPIAATAGILILIIKVMNKLLKMPISSALKIKEGVLAGFIDLVSGIVITFLFIALAGYVATKIGRKGIFEAIDEVVKKLPVISSFYNSIKQLIDFVILSKGKEGFRSVVLVEYPRKGVWAVGFVTAKSGERIEKAVGKPLINLYIPNSFDLAAGFFILAPEDEVFPLNLSVDEGFKMVVSGGLVFPQWQK